MVAADKTPVHDVTRGRKLLKHIVNCQYSLLVSTATGIAGAVCFFIIGPRDVVGITGIVVAFLAVRKLQVIRFYSTDKISVGSICCLLDPSSDISLAIL